MSKLNLMFTSSAITLHELDNSLISVPKLDIRKLVDIADNTSFPKLKTQVILDQRSILCAGGRDYWLYVTESIKEIEQLLENG